ncbi:hypothetical protein [Streptomyces sp. NPDC057686]
MVDEFLLDVEGGAADAEEGGVGRADGAERAGTQLQGEDEGAERGGGRE